MLLYTVTDEMWLKEGQTLASVTEEVLKNGATFLQIREKELGDADFLNQAKALKEVAARYGVPYVVNDNIQVALECDANGVHVGQSDIVGKDVRSMIGPDKILGISANTVETAIAAEKAARRRHGGAAGKGPEDGGFPWISAARSLTWTARW